MARFELRQRDAAVRAAVLLGEHLRRGLRPVVPRDLHESLGEPQRRLDGIREPPAIVGPHRHAVHHHRHVMVLPAVQLGRLGELDERAIDIRAYEALLARVLEQLAELALAPAHERREHLDARAVGPAEHHVRDL
jgi:hypothetical protein